MPAAATTPPARVEIGEWDVAVRSHFDDTSMLVLLVSLWADTVSLSDSFWTGRWLPDLSPFALVQNDPVDGAL